jgi:non-heme chloroperoxidase
MMGNPDGFATLEEAAAAVQAYGGESRRVNPASLARNLRLDDEGRFHWHWDPRFMQLMANRDEAALQLMEQRCTAAAANLVVPILLVRGGSSDVVDEGGVRHFLAEVPHGRYVNVAGAGHMITGDRNDAFTGAVLRFLDDLGPVKGSP